MRLAFLFPIAFFLSGCVDKREICARFNATGTLLLVTKKHLEQTYKDLGMERLYDSDRGYRANYGAINAYCEFYKS